MYELFLDAVSKQWKMILFCNWSQINQQSIFLAGNESSLLWDKVLSFFKKCSIEVFELHHIYVVHGPGSFTGIRSICLFVNTLAYISQKLTLTPISFFDLYTSYPIIKQSSRRDVFAKKQKNSIIEILSISELQIYLQDISQCYGSSDATNIDNDICLEENYQAWDVISRIKKQQYKRIEPLYIKQANIS